MSKYLIFLGIITSLLLLMFLFSSVVQEYQTAEIEYLIDRADIRGKSNISLSILGQLQLFEKRIKNQKEPVSLYRDEARVQVLESRMEFLASGDGDQGTLPVIVRLARWLYNKHNTLPAAEVSTLEDIKIAYFWERSRKYDKALEIYSDIIEAGKLGPDIKVPVQLHMAFCMIGKAAYKKATNLCTILTKSRESEIIQAAYAMLNLIRTIEDKIFSTDTSEMSIIEEGLHYYFTLQYKKATRLFSEYIEDMSGSEKEIDLKILFYFARSLEHLGETKAAVEKYQHIIHIDKQSPWAIESARRLFMIDSFYEQQVDNIQQTISFLESWEDPVLENAEFKELYIPTKDDSPDVDSETDIRKQSTYTDEETNELIQTKQPSPTRATEIAILAEQPYQNEFINEFDESGLKTKSVYYNQKSEIEYFITYGYTETGQIKKVSQFDGEGTLVKYYIYTYDDNGNPQYVIGYDQNGNVIIE